MIESLEVIVAKARDVIVQLTKPNGEHPSLRLVKLKPRDEDYAAVFVGAAVDSARAGYAGLWAQVPPWPVKPEQTNIRVGAAYAQDFSKDDPRTKPFPGGYKTISQWLVPGRVWLVWEHVAPGSSDGILFDGLVALPDHFAWFPKPWRVVPQAP